eukprot:3327174-Heterocapsa_arctica.AAC.1
MPGALSRCGINPLTCAEKKKQLYYTIGAGCERILREYERGGEVYDAIWSHARRTDQDKAKSDFEQRRGAGTNCEAKGGLAIPNTLKPNRK